MNAAQRARDLDALTHQRVDLLVVGGGVTGCGVALDAVTRGLSVALVERYDLASGTSRWSSKLVHGGLRYLAQGDVRLARESARERAVLMGRTAPHLVRTLPMVVPAVPTLPKAKMAAINIGHHASHLLGTGGPAALPRPRRLSAEATVGLLPGLRPDGLRGGYVLYDGQLEDDARLVLGLARTAAAYGARIVTYARADRIDGHGADVTDVRTGVGLRITARAVVNACGVWAGDLDDNVQMRPSKGAHLVLPASAFGFPTASMTVAVPGESNRYVFALPQPDGLVYLGLTDDPVDGRPPDEPEASPADAEFLLATFSPHLRRPITSADVVGSFAGLRPLLTGTGGRTADLSRRHAVRRGAHGAWSVIGGKLTTYRLMAQDAVDATALAAGPCRTTDLPLLGAGRAAPRGTVPARLVRRYGAEAGQVAALADEAPELLRPVAPGVPVLGVELAWGVQAEGALTVDDLLARRTRLSLVTAWAQAAQPAAESILAAYG
jgi:glycerol-3-phosphate dehydrogenase